MEIDNSNCKNKKKFMKKKTIYLIILTGFYFILFCTHLFSSLLENEPFHSFNIYYSLLPLWQSITITLHRNINIKSYNVFFYKVLVGMHSIEFILLLIMLIILPLHFSVIRFFYLIIAIFQSYITLLLFSKNSRVQFFIKMYFINQNLAKRFIKYLEDNLNKFSNNDKNNTNNNRINDLIDNNNQYHLTINQSTFNPIEIKVKDIVEDQQLSVPSNLTVKSYDYSHERNSYIISNNEQNKKSIIVESNDNGLNSETNNYNSSNIQTIQYQSQNNNINHSITNTTLSCNNTSSYDHLIDSISYNKQNSSTSVDNILISNNNNGEILNDSMINNQIPVTNTITLTNENNNNSSIQNNEVKLTSQIPLEASRYSQDSYSNDSYSSSSSTPISPSNQLLSPITQSTEPSHISSLITPSVHISQSSSYITSFSQPSQLQSTSIPPSRISQRTSQLNQNNTFLNPSTHVNSSNVPHNQPSQFHPSPLPVTQNIQPLPVSQNIQPLPLSSSQNTNTNKLHVSGIIKDIQPSIINQNYDDNLKKISHFYKLFRFLVQLSYIGLLILIFFRTIVYNYDDQFFYKIIPGQITNINNINNSKNLFSLHIQCSGQGPVTVSKILLIIIIDF